MPPKQPDQLHAFQWSLKVPSRWELAPVAATGFLTVGKQRTPLNVREGVPIKYIRAANIGPDGLRLDDVLEMRFTNDERRTYELLSGDVVLAEASGSPDQVGRPAIWEGEIAPCCFQNTVIRYRSPIVNSHFALIVFRFCVESGLFTRISRGVGIQHLSLKRLAQLQMPVPPREEQDRIVAVFEKKASQLHNAEEALRSALDGLQTQSKEVVAAAVTGQLVESEADLAFYEGRLPTTAEDLLRRVATKPSESKLLPADKPKRKNFTQQSTGALPRGWTLARVGEVGSLKVGKQKTLEHGHAPKPYLRAANVTEDGFDLTNLKAMGFSATEQKAYDVVPGDVLIVEASGSPGQVGRAAVWTGEHSDLHFQNHLIRFRSTIVHPQFAWLVFQHMRDTGVFQRTARGIGLQHLGLARLSQLPFPVPPRSEQERIVEEARRRLSALQRQRAAITSVLERTATIKRELSVAALSGQLADELVDDEPAASLLSSFQQIQARSALAAKQRRRLHARSMPQRDSQVDMLRPTLAEVLRAAKKPLPLPELLIRAKYDPDSIEDVERFFLALRKDLGRTVRVKGAKSENALVEAI